MINVICTVIGTGIVIGGVIAGILKGFFKTNKEAETDHDKLKANFEKDIKEIKAECEKAISDIKNEFNNSLVILEERLEKEFKKDNTTIKDELSRIFNKIDDIKTHYVTNDNFKTYADAMNQLLMMSNERMSRMESVLDDIRDNIREDIATAMLKFNHND